MIFKNSHSKMTKEHLKKNENKKYNHESPLKFKKMIFKGKHNLDYKI